MEAQCIKKKENCIYESLFFVNQVATAHKTPQTETHSFKKKKKTQEKEYVIPPNKTTGRKTKAKNQWRHQATRNLMIKGL